MCVGRFRKAGKTKEVGIHRDEWRRGTNREQTGVQIQR